MSARPRVVLLVLLALAVGVRVVHLSALPDDPLFRAPTLDALYHLHHARGLALDDWSLPDGVPDPEVRTTPLHRPVGYPLFLALLTVAFDSPWSPRVAHALLGLLAGALAFLLARRVRPDDPVAPLGAAAFVWLSPLQLLFETELQAATLTGVLLLGAGALSLRLHERRDVVTAALFGVVLGLAVLVRPNLAPLGLLVLAPATAAARAGGRRRALALVVVPALVVLAINAGVPVRNQGASGEARLTSTNGAVSLLFANHENADGVENVPPPGDTFRGVQALSPFGYPRFKRTVERNLGRALSFGELGSLCTASFHRFAGEHPGTLLALTGKRLALLLGPRSISNNREVAVLLDERLALRFLPARFFLLIALACAGAGALLARRRDDEHARRGLLLVGAALLYLLPLTLFFAGSRFRAPLVPLLAVLAGVGAAALVRAARERTGARAVVVGLALGALTWTFAPLAPAPRPARHHVQRAVAWQTLGDDERAAADLARAQRLGDAGADAQITLGYLELGRGRAREAEASFRDALRTSADTAALAGLGTALVQQGRAAAAVPFLERACEQDPEHEAALYNLGLARFAARDAAGAATAYERLLRAHPEHQDGRTNLARTYLALGRAQDAVPLLDVVLRARPDDRAAALNRAIALERSDRADEAITAYRALLARGDDDVDALTNLGVLLMKRGSREALPLLARAAALRPTHPGIQLNLVTAHLNAGAFADARRAFERALTQVAAKDHPTLRGFEQRVCASPSPPPAAFCAAP